MTNTQIQHKTEYVQKKILEMKDMQDKETDRDVKHCYKGMIDDLEIIIINLPVEEVEYHKSAYGVEEDEFTAEEIQEHVQQRADDLEASRGQY